MTEFLMGQDWVQNRNIREVSSELDALRSQAYSDSSRLRSELSRIRGSLESKVDRLTAAFEAFVELSDIREQMAVYTDAAIVRHQVRLMFAAVGAGRTPEPPELPDVPGYWLVPGARALYARMSGEPTRAAKYAEAAIELGGERARYFLIAGARLAEPIDLTAVELAALLPKGENVTRAQRDFWLAAAAGAFGGAGRALAINAVSGALGAEPKATEPWLTGVRRFSRGSVADMLSGLREHCTTRPVEASPEPAAAAADERPAADREQDQPIAALAALVEALINEGHDPERPLLRRAEKLRGLVERGVAPEPYRAYDEPVGTMTELAYADAFEGTAPSSARTVALRAAGPWLLAAARDVVATAPVPAAHDTVRLRGRDVAIVGTAPDPAAMKKIRADLAAGYESHPAQQYVGFGFAAVGLVAAVIGFAIGQVAIGLLGLLVLLVGAIVGIVGRSRERDRARYRETETARLETESRTAVQKALEHQQRQQRERDRADAELAALSETLA